MFGRGWRGGYMEEAASWESLPSLPSRNLFQAQFDAHHLESVATAHLMFTLPSSRRKQQKNPQNFCPFPTLLPRPFRHSNCRELKALGVAKSVDDKYRSAVTRGSWVARKRGQGSGLKDLSTYRLLKGPSAGHPDSFPTPSTPATTDCVNTLQ